MARTPRSRKSSSRSNPHQDHTGEERARRPGRPKKLREGLISNPIVPKTPNQKEYFESILKNSITICDGPAGSGKSLPVWENVLTDNGFKPIGELRIGDWIYGSDGKPTQVTGIYPQGELDIYKCSFSKGVTVHCSGDHLWSFTYEKDETKTVHTKTLLEISKELVNSSNSHISFPHPKPVELPERDLSCDPYAMGMILTCVDKRNNAFQSEEKENFNAVLYGLATEALRKTLSYSYDVRKELKRVGLLGKYHNEIFIPKDYIFASIKQRQKLLAGILEGKQATFMKYRIKIASGSEQFIKDVCTLARSLGHEADYFKSVQFYTDGSDCSTFKVQISPAYNPFIDPVFRAKAEEKIKAGMYKVEGRMRLREVEPAGKAECVCIRVSNKDGLFIANDFALTHNTAIATYLALELLIKGKVKKIIITRPAVEVGKSIGFLPGKIEDKMKPYLTPILDCISDFSSLPELMDRIEMGSLSLMRGRTFKDAFIILDEGSSCTFEELKMIITRLGEGSKMVINGDVMQSDLPSHQQGALKSFIEKLGGIPDIGVVVLEGKDIQRHPLIAKILARISPDDLVVNEDEVDEDEEGDL